MLLDIIEGEELIASAVVHQQVVIASLFGGLSCHPLCLTG